MHQKVGPSNFVAGATKTRLKKAWPSSRRSTNVGIMRAHELTIASKPLAEFVVPAERSAMKPNGDHQWYPSAGGKCARRSGSRTSSSWN